MKQTLFTEEDVKRDIEQICDYIYDAWNTNNLTAEEMFKGMLKEYMKDAFSISADFYDECQHLVNEKLEDVIEDTRSKYRNQDYER